MKDIVASRHRMDTHKPVECSAFTLSIYIYRTWEYVHIYKYIASYAYVQVLPIWVDPSGFRSPTCTRKELGKGKGVDQPCWGFAPGDEWLAAIG